MRSTTATATNLATLLLLTTIQTATAIPSTDGAGIFGTTCWPDKGKQDSSTKDCEKAIEAVLENDVHAGLGGHKDGCVEVASSGGCAVSLCDVSSESGVVAYGAIAMAAQVIHAVCKGNPSTHSTGGFGTVAGMGVPGVKAIVGTVELGKKSFVDRELRRVKRNLDTTTPKRFEVPSGRSTTTKVKGRAEPDEQVNVPGTNHRIVRIFADEFPDFDGEDLSVQDQRRLRDQLVNLWNNGQGSPTVVTASIDIGTTRYVLEYTAYNNADLNRVAEGNRINLIDSFFIMRARNNNAPILHARLEVTDGTPLGTLQLLQVNVVPFQQDPADDPFGDPEDDPFADPPDNPNGTNPFADPMTILHIAGCY